MNLYENLYKSAYDELSTSVAMLENDVRKANESIDALSGPDYSFWSARANENLRNANAALEKANIYDVLCNSSDGTDAMRAFAVKLSYPVYSVKTDDSGRFEIVRPNSADASRKVFDLKKAHKLSVSGIGNDVDWMNEAAALRAVMTAALCVDVKVKSTDGDGSYWDMDAAARVVDNVLDSIKVPRKAWAYIDASGDKAVSLSKSRQKAMLTRLVHDMVGDEVKVRSYDYKWLQNAFATFGIKSGLKTANQQKFIQLLLVICHCALTGEQYDVTYKVRDMSKPNPRYRAM